MKRTTLFLLVIGVAVVALVIGTCSSSWEKLNPKKTMAQLEQYHEELTRQTQLECQISGNKSLAEGDATQVSLTVTFTGNVPPDEQVAAIRTANVVARQIFKDLGTVEVYFRPSMPLAQLPPRLGGVPNAPDSGNAGAIPGAPSPAPPQAPVTPPPATAVGAPMVKVITPAAKSSPPTGKLTLVTFPPAKVTEGNHVVGTTPIFNLTLSAGTHLFTVMGDDHRAHHLSVPITAGNTRTMKVQLAELP